MNRVIKDNKGFTLVEIFIAILIFSVVISTVFSSFKAFIISSETIREEVVHSEKIRNIFKRITLDFESIFVVQPPRYKKPQFNADPDPYRFVGNEKTIGQQVVSTLVFPSFAHAKFGVDQRAGVARIVYYLKENQDDMLDLHRADALPPYPEEPESCSDPVLIKNISGFEAVYFDFKGDEYKYWDSEDQEFNYTFPVSINLKVTFGSGEMQQVFETSIRLISGREPIE